MERHAPELDPQVRDAVETFERAGLPPWYSLSVESARTVEDEAFAATDPPAVERVREFAVPGPRGPIPVRTYHPEPSETRGVLVFYHGGGWTLGTLGSADGICRRLADRSGRLVVSVDYRLAPEHPFPEPLDDAVAAYEWAREHAGSLGGDEGDGEEMDPVPTPTGQLLLYPILAQTFDTDSYEENADGPLLSRADMAWFRDHYLRSQVDRYSPFAAPALADDELLAATPPACVVTGGFDPLRDEGTRYAARLRDLGVGVVHQHYPAMVHGFLSLAAEVDAADEAFDRVAERLGEF
ncbi:alpha/beta hydrolase fold-3 domain protein [Halogeometricum pallidum JCM 14848]|uniref:Alpha/beta hydrolase fold-3 domain protein n=1 Tax=Halogeometricum pallidum JCM 14848 TaxID=1227487 RepID=M0DF76_HALPD|nr:alpha/beta hydrolase [Halogeometricum pallidum]ELZ32819.1 alpha/beta hydrolase fold-3 domain protein [Halogeometricum pallidum JCM 14848]